MPNRMVRKDAAKYLGIGLSTFDKLQREGCLEGTYMEIFSRRFYYTERLDKWMSEGGTMYGKTN